jgi:hypothetical protein
MKTRARKVSMAIGFETGKAARHNYYDDRRWRKRFSLGAPLVKQRRRRCLVWSHHVLDVDSTSITRPFSLPEQERLHDSRPLANVPVDMVRRRYRHTNTEGKMMNCLSLLRRYWRMFFVIALCCGLVRVFAQTSAQTQSASPPFLLTISAINPSVKVGAVVWIKVAMKNKSQHDISVYVANAEDQGGWVYTVDVRDDRGRTPVQTEYARSIGAMGSGGRVPLHAAETRTDLVNVSKLYDLNEPGRYTIQFQRFDEETKTFVSSNKITVTVTA